MCYPQPLRCVVIDSRNFIQLFEYAILTSIVHVGSGGGRGGGEGLPKSNFRQHDGFISETGQEVSKGSFDSKIQASSTPRVFRLNVSSMRMLEMEYYTWRLFLYFFHFFSITKNNPLIYPHKLTILRYEIITNENDFTHILLYKNAM